MVQIFDYGSVLIKKDSEDIPIEYIVMEYIPGATVRFTMPEGGFYPNEKDASAWIVDYFLTVLDGVQALHEAGVIHRDVKPENYLLDGKIPKITDFGLARSVKLESVTESLDVIGTPPYMAPEHFYDFRRVDQRGDIYSLGKILFEAIAGKMPPTTIPFKSAKLSNPNTPFFQALDRIIQKATAEDKNSRPESVEKFRMALQEAIDSLKTEIVPDARTFKRLWAGIAVAIFSVAAMIIWHLAGNPWMQKKPSPQADVSRGKALPSTPSGPSGTKPLAPSLPKSIMGKDGMNMRLIPDGVPRTGRGEKTIRLPSFYMDETKVTVHHFVDFLNSIRHELTVENGVVRRGSETWLLLETGGQIVYRHSRFHIPDLKNAAQPVVRVTWYGASAFARYFDKDVPTADEWKYAAQTGDLLPGAPNKFDLKGYGGNIREWVVPVRDDRKSRGRLIKPQAGSSHPSLVVGKSFPTREPGAQGIIRKFADPWEGFGDVGFRCVASINRTVTW